ncbi:MAG: hypothetical protein GX663_06310 [Clostridiales bacterium]|nr:hypothetical protein [Clostridiales bacterium]
MKKVYLSSMAKKPLIEYVTSIGYEPVFIDGKDSPLSDSVATHPDIYMCSLGTNEDAELFHGSTDALGSRYPADIIYNAVCTEEFFIHNMDYTAKALSEKALSKETLSEIRPPAGAAGRKKVNVSQGYTRCCCLPVDSQSFITSDRGIAKALDVAGADVLLISQGHVKLQGFEYGFIGGCGGRIFTHGKPVVIFNGDLSSHPDYLAIKQFIEDRSNAIMFFEEYQLEDIGSIIPEDIGNSTSEKL